MNQFVLSDVFDNIKDYLEIISDFLGDKIREAADFFESLPVAVKAAFYFLSLLAVLGILLSHFLGIYRNRSEWKPKPDSELMFSYFCGSGQFQRKKSYQTAHELLCDRKWSWVSMAGLAYRLGNFTHQSRVLTFICSLLYFPMAILGFVEMVLRIILGTVWLLCTGLAHRMILFVLQWVSYLLIPVWRTADKGARVEQHCPHCYATFDLPEFKCPHCDVVHEQLIPSRCGMMIARCECGGFISSSAYTGRSRLNAVCPKCDGDLCAANAKQFSLQLVGGAASGKTSFLAAFQHLYMEHSLGTKNLSIYGKPQDDFAKMEQLFKGGNSLSFSTEVLIYSMVHKIRRTPRHNLVIFDIPDQAIRSGLYERNPLNFGYTDGIIIVVDPLSIASVREECGKLGDTKATEGCSHYSQDEINTMIVSFIHQFSEIIGRSARKMIDTPVAVVISKADVKAVKREIGLPKIKVTYDTNPGAYKNGKEQARDEMCREYLYNLGLSNALNNLESTFSNVRYFPVSAMGHLSGSGRPFEPFGIMEPITWIAQDARSGIYKTLQNAQGRASQ